MFSFETFFKVIAIGFLYVNICIQGKRAIIFYAIINLMVVLYAHILYLVKNNRSIRRFVLFSGVLAIAGASSMLYLTSLVKSERTGGLIDDNTMYTAMRIDFLRDDRVRTAIYYSVYPDEISVVDFPGQTFIRDFMSFIPLNYIQDKIGWNKETYQTRFTHALMHKDPKLGMDVEESWMTVTFFAELISNLGVFIGFILIATGCLWFITKIDMYPYPYNAFIICCFVLMNLFDFSYIAVFVEYTLIICWLYKKKNNKWINESFSNRAVAKRGRW